MVSISLGAVLRTSALKKGGLFGHGPAGLIRRRGVRVRGGGQGIARGDPPSRFSAQRQGDPEENGVERGAGADRGETLAAEPSCCWRIPRNTTVGSPRAGGGLYLHCLLWHVGGG